MGKFMKHDIEPILRVPRPLPHTLPRENDTSAVPALAEANTLHPKVVLDLIGTKPLMAICVGMQILAKYGEESSGVQALGVFPGQITQFSKSMKTELGASLKVPHMGWNEVIQQPHPMWSGIPDRTRFYFVHSYCYADASADCVIGRCEYGPTFAAALARQNVFAVQFHPEKSHDAGIHLYSNFLSWDGTC